MSITIHPYLIARFKAVQAAFMQPGFRVPAMAFETTTVVPTPPQPNNWKKLLGEDEEGEGDGGGGGTIRGNRGKNAEHAKAAMRKLTRAGR
jgi:hypothetical protein